MRPHDNVKHYCGRKEDETGKHGCHFITYRSGKAFCTRCEDRQRSNDVTERCSYACGDCDNCQPCSLGFVASGKIEVPTAEEFSKAIPYSTDLLDRLK